MFFNIRLLFFILYSEEILSNSVFLLVLNDSKTTFSKLSLLLILFAVISLLKSNPIITGFFIVTSPSAFKESKNSSKLDAFPLIVNFELISDCILL